jgi:hypothetical protein
MSPTGLIFLYPVLRCYVYSQYVKDTIMPEQPDMSEFEKEFTEPVYKELADRVEAQSERGSGEELSEDEAKRISDGVLSRITDSMYENPQCEEEEEGYLTMRLGTVEVTAGTIFAENSSKIYEEAILTLVDPDGSQTNYDLAWQQVPMVERLKDDEVIEPQRPIKQADLEQLFDALKVVEESRN